MSTIFAKAASTFTSETLLLSLHCTAWVLVEKAGLVVELILLSKVRRLVVWNWFAMDVAKCN